MTIETETITQTAQEPGLRGPLRIIAWVLACGSVLYVVQVMTPLRLTTDGIYYLSFADSAARGGGLTAFYQEHFLLPKGYSLFLFCLMKTGIFSALTLVIANLFFFSTGLLLSFETLLDLGFERGYSAMLCMLAMLSFTSVKNITLPMSDFLFFALSAAAWRLMNLPSRSRWLAFLAAACAVEVRLAGIALFVPLAFMAWSSLAKRPTWLLSFLFVLGAGLALGIWSGKRYFNDYLRYVQDIGIFRIAKNVAVFHSRDFGELLTNFPLAKLPSCGHFPLQAAGAVELVLFVIGMFTLRRRSQLLFFYLLGFSLIILPWPFTDPRFWLPAMPFVFLAIHQAVAWRRWGAVRLFFAVYVVVFCVLGFAALGYSTWLTFSGPQFAYRYGDGNLRATYLGGCAAEGDDVNQDAANLLKRYEWHCDDAQ